MNVSSASIDPPSKGNALLLTTNTEVSIAPKLHRSRDKVSSKPFINGHVTTTASVNANEKPAVDGDVKSPLNSLSEVLRVLPARLVAGFKFFEHDGPELLAAVSSRTMTSLQPTHPKSNSQVVGSFYRGTFKILIAPSDPSSSSLAPAAEPSAKVLNPGTHTNSTSALDKTPLNPNDIFIGTAENIPQGHIVFYALPDGLEEWDLVRYYIRILQFLYQAEVLF